MTISLAHGAARLAAATLTTIYTCPAGKLATINVNFCNTSNQAAKVSWYYSTTNPPGPADDRESKITLLPAGDPSNGNACEFTSKVLDAGKMIVCYADIAGVVASVNGLAEDV